MGWPLIIAEARGTKAMFAGLAPKASLYELGPVLFCVRLLESRAKRGKLIGCVLTELTHLLPCCVSLVSKKDNFLADG